MRWIRFALCVASGDSETSRVPCWPGGSQRDKQRGEGGAGGKPNPLLSSASKRRAHARASVPLPSDAAAGWGFLH